MNTLTTKIFALLVLMSLGGVANADLITAEDTYTPGDGYIGYFESHTFTHDINDDGFSLGSLVSGSIAISILDDQDDLTIDFGIFGGVVDIEPEILLFTIDGFDLDTGGLSFGSYSTGLGVSAFGTLNDTGLLSITVQSLIGDFYLAQSVLSVTAEAAAVPVPGTLLLMGLGLSAVGFSRRRKVVAAA